LIGEPVTLAEPVDADSNLWGGTPISVGRDLLAYRGGHFGTMRLTWLDREGREVGTVGPQATITTSPSPPDGGELVTTDEQGTYLIMLDLATSALRRFTFKPERIVRSSWSPDGRSIAYDSTRNGPFGIFIVPATGTGAEETLLGTEEGRDLVFSPDGRVLLYEKSSDPRTQYDLWMVALSGDRKPQPFLRTANEAHPTFSPNRR
jgi:dipeptidyl aminopeptidase/acylaminoacyl peptidase